MGADSIIVKPASLDEITKKILTLFDDNKDAQTVAKCREKIKLGDIQEASQLAQTLTTTLKSKSRGFTLMGEVFREKGDHKQARKCYRKAHSLSPDYLEPLHGLVEIAQNEDEKLDYLEKLDKISPMNSSRKIEIGKMYASRGKVDQAEKYFKSAVTALNHIHTATKASAVSDIAEFYKEIDINKSIQYMKAAIRLKKDRLGPGDFGMFNEIGLSLRKQGRWEEAIDYYRMALNIAENPGLYFNIGMAYMQGKQYLKSIDHMTKAIHMDSGLLDSSPFIPSNLGIAYAKTKNFDQALLYLEKALELDPEHGPSLDYLARMNKT
jgi:tetratricopeptide (TPR) repeat protein